MESAIKLGIVLALVSSHPAMAGEARQPESTKLRFALDSSKWPFTLTSTDKPVHVALGDHVIFIPPTVTTTFQQHCFKPGDGWWIFGDPDDDMTKPISFTWHPPLKLLFLEAPINVQRSKSHYVPLADGDLHPAVTTYGSQTYKDNETKSQCPPGYEFKGLVSQPALPKSVELEVIVCRAGVPGQSPECEGP